MAVHIPFLSRYFFFQFAQTIMLQLDLLFTSLLYYI